MSGGGGARVSIAGGLKKMIQDIREIAGEHSDEDIYAMLKECSMDPNETAQRLFHLDTFHEVKKKHGKRKENVVIKAYDIPGKQRGARVGRGAKVGGGNIHSQNTLQINARGSFRGSRENGYPNMSKGHKSETKIAPKGSRSVHVKINGKSIKDEAPQPVGTLSYAGQDPVSETVKSFETHVPADKVKSWAMKLAPASISVKQEKVTSVESHVDSAAPVVLLQPLASVSSETVRIGLIAPGNTAHEKQHAVSNGNANWSNDKMPNAVSHTKIVDAAESQATNFKDNGQACQAKEKQPISEEDISVLNEEASKLAVSDVSDGHVVFPEHLQVPEAYKEKLTFGSFGSTWPLDVKHTSDDSAVSTDMPMQADDSYPVKTVAKPSIESIGGISSTVKDAQETENPSYIQSPQPISISTPPLFERASSDVVIKIDEPETESLYSNGGPDIAYHPSNHVFGYAPKPQLQANDSAGRQVENFITLSTSTSGVDWNNNIQPPELASDSISSPPPAPFLRQTYHPNFLTYGHYYPQFFVPQVQQYVTHGGFPQQPLLPNIYLTSPAAGGIKFPHQQLKQGSNAGTDGYISVPSGYNPYVPYAFPYGLPPAVIPCNVAGDDDHATQLKENAALTTDQQTEGSGEWMAGPGQTASGLQMNSFYNLAPGQGHPMVFPPTPTGFGPFGGVYHHPSVQTILAPQPTMHLHNQQPHSMTPAEPPPQTGFYQQQQQQQPQGAHILRNNNKQ